MKFLCSSKINLLLLGFAIGLLVGGGGSAKAEFIWGTPTNMGPIVNASGMDGHPTITPDGLCLFFVSDRPGGSGFYDLWVTTRATIDDPWREPVNLGPTVNSSGREQGPSISADGCTLYFCSARPAGSGDRDIWMTKRPTVSNPWGTPVNLGPPVNSSSSDDDSPSISADGLCLFFVSDRPGGSGFYDLWVTTRATIDDPWGPPANLEPTVNSSFVDTGPDISADGLTLFFRSDRPGGSGSWDLWVTTRATANDPWGEPVNLEPPVNSPSEDATPHISADGSTLYFCSNRPIGGFTPVDIWQVPISPLVDFSRDGRVDFKDFSILALYWLQDESLVDIAPPPIGDDMVDFEDLRVFAENWLTVAPPAQASNPNPANDAFSVDLNADLSWTTGSGATSHDVYFGTNPIPGPGEFQRNQTETTFDPGTMGQSTTYYWRIDEVNAWGKTTGTVWHFTTESGPPP